MPIRVFGGKVSIKKIPLKKGDHGLDVSRLQVVLVKMNLLGTKTPQGKPMPNGVFDDVTETALRQFQRLLELPQTGILDFETLKALIPYRTIKVAGSYCGLHSGPAMRLRLLPDLRLGRKPDLTYHPVINMPGTPAVGPPTPAPSPAKGGADVIGQAQLGGQYVAKPFFTTKPSGWTPLERSLSLQFQAWLTYRSAQDGTHVEIGMGPGIAADQKVSHNDPRFTFTGSFSLTVADIFAPGSFHLLSPQLQLSVYNNTSDSMKTLSSGFGASIGNQMSIDIKKDVLSFQVTPAIYMNVDCRTGQMTLAPGISGAFQVNF